jgi:ABC-type dipeptide/oligopeptide/nickel transport system permease component
MLRYTIKRLLALIPILLFVSFVTFGMVRLARVIRR